MSTEEMSGVTVLVCPADGPPVATDGDALDLVVQAMEQGADIVLIPAERLSDDFFRLRTGVAGAIVQKFVNYRKRLAVVGDISARLDASPTLRDFVGEANRGRQIWFVPSTEDLAARLTG
jgi:hypothetical protein